MRWVAAPGGFQKNGEGRLVRGPDSRIIVEESRSALAIIRYPVLKRRLLACRAIERAGEWSTIPLPFACLASRWLAGRVTRWTGLAYDAHGTAVTSR